MELSALNIPRAYPEVIQTLKICRSPEDTRAGPVYSFSYPVTLSIINPMERVLFDETRDANPFFHLMEAIWMFAGEQRVDWLLAFNKGFAKFAEPDGVQRGAYGFRWRFHFGFDQIQEVVRKLKKNPADRRVVIAMWDAGYDNSEGYQDYPCNTHLYFRIVNGRLDMTVCNRSQDLIWGMLGSNCVHMTMLQELMASAIGVPIGVYRVFTNNLHIYRNLPKFDEIWETNAHRDLYGGEDRVVPFPILGQEEELKRFFLDCRYFIYGHFDEIQSEFLKNIAIPMLHAYFAPRRNAYQHLIQMPDNNDWRKACEEWILRRILSSSTSTELSQTTITGTTSSAERTR